MSIQTKLVFKSAIKAALLCTIAPTLVMAETQKLSNSLLFDQDFDSHSVRPFVETKSHNVEFKLEAPTPWTKKSNSALKAASPNAYVVEHELTKTLQETSPLEKIAKDVFIAKKQPKLVVTTKVKTEPKAKPIENISKLYKSGVYAFDAQDLNFSKITPIVGARVIWVGIESRLETKSNNFGYTKAPYPKTKSQKYFVYAPGYLPAMGYYVNGAISVAPMYKAELLKPLIETLGIASSNGHIVLAKALDEKFKPVSNLKMDLSQLQNTKVDYAVGSWGLFVEGKKQTGASGDMVITGLESSLQYLMPVEVGEGEEWPSTIVDLSAAPQVFSIGLIRPQKHFAETKVLDAFVLDRPAGGVSLTIGGQRGVYIPEEDGTTLIENLYKRSSVDLFEVRAPSYLKTWVNVPATPEQTPEFSPLLSKVQVHELFDAANTRWNEQDSVVIGMIAENNIASPVQIRVMSPTGRINRNAQVYYFDRNNSVNTSIKDTRYSPRFLVVGLEKGEWSLISVDLQTKGGVGSATLRTDSETISYIEL